MTPSFFSYIGNTFAETATVLLRLDFAGSIKPLDISHNLRAVAPTVARLAAELISFGFLIA